MTIVPLTGLQPLESIFDKQGAGMPCAQNMGGAVPIFSDILKDAIANVEQTQAVSQQDAYDLAMGKTDDLHTVQINALKASAAVEMAAGITSRALGAYKEIMQTQL